MVQANLDEEKWLWGVDDSGFSYNPTKPFCGFKNPENSAKIFKSLGFNPPWDEATGEPKGVITKIEGQNYA